MAIFGISDLHLSLSADKPMDVFRGWDNYVERITANWRRLVSPKDTVVIPGDISWALKLEETKADFEYINSLPGKKLLLKGNHDLWWGTLTKLEAFFDQNGFDTLKCVFNSAAVCGDYAVCGTRGWCFEGKAADKKVVLREAARLETSLTAAENTGKQPLVFLHYPPYFNGQVSGEIFDVLVKHGIKEVWHGHIHGGGKSFSESEYGGIKLNLISADCIDFCPVLVKK